MPNTSTTFTSTVYVPGASYVCVALTVSSVRRARVRNACQPLWNVSSRWSKSTAQ